MKRFLGDNDLINEYNDLCEAGHNVARHNGLTFHHILPRCMFPEEKDNPDNWTWLSFEDHWLAHYLLWKGTGLPVYAAAFWFICVYGIKNRGMSISEEDYNQLKHDVSVHNAQMREEKRKERYERFKARTNQNSSVE